MKARIKNKREFIKINKTLKANIKSVHEKMTPKQQIKFNIITNNIRKMQRQPKRRLISIIKAHEIQQKNARRKKHG